jgi:hypothetical protein
MITQLVPLLTRVVHLPAVLAEKSVAAAVVVANGSTLEEAEVTAPVLMVFNPNVRPGYNEAVGKVTAIAEAELNVINRLVCGTVKVAAVTGVVTLATAKTVSSSRKSRAVLRVVPQPV